MAGIEAPRALLTGNIQSDDVHIKGPLKLEIFRGDRTGGKVALEALRERAAVVYYQGFGVGIMQTADEVRESLVRGGSVFFVRKDDRDIAISIQHNMRVLIPTDDRGSQRYARVTYTASRLILPAYQEQGVGKWTMEVEYNEYKPDYFVGRTQNPAIHLGWKSLPFTGEDRPIDADYRGEDLKTRQFRGIMWAVVQRTYGGEVDINTGLARSVYKEGETKGYVPNLSNQRYVEIDRRMLSLGLVRARGDTLYYVIETIEPGKDQQA